MAKKIKGKINKQITSLIILKKVEEKEKSPEVLALEQEIE